MWCPSRKAPPEAAPRGRKQNRTARFLNLARGLGLLAGLILSSPVGADEETIEIRRLVIGLDLSASNPLTENKAYAAKLAAWVAQEVKKLRLGAVVHIRTFGVSDATKNTLRADLQVTLRNTPDKIAAQLSALIEHIPDLVTAGKLEAQQETNIVGFIRTNIRVIGECNTPTAFILLTDGLEDSEYGHLTSSGGSLMSPVIKPPRDKRYKCEELVLLGLGAATGGSSQTDRLRTVWAGWVKGKAPFKRFRALDDW